MFCLAMEGNLDKFNQLIFPQTNMYPVCGMAQVRPAPTCIFTIVVWLNVSAVVTQHAISWLICSSSRLCLAHGWGPSPYHLTLCHDQCYFHCSWFQFCTTHILHIIGNFTLSSWQCQIQYFKPYLKTYICMYVIIKISS